MLIKKLFFGGGDMFLNIYIFISYKHVQSKNEASSKIDNLLVPFRRSLSTHTRVYIQLLRLKDEFVRLSLKMIFIEKSKEDVKV